MAEALGTLQPGERMAVLPFAAAPAPALLAPGWVAGGENAKRDALVRAVGALEAGGSTDLVAALAAAGRHVATAPARRRRVLLLTDGDPDREPDPVALGRLARGLEAQGVRFRAVVSGSAALAKRLSDGLGAKPGEVVELPDAGRIPRALLRVLAEARSRGERLGPPASITWVGGAPGPLAGLAPAWVHAVDAAPSAQVLAVAAWADGQTARPFAARRDVGAGAVFALAWGPAAEPTRREASASLARLVPWISDLAGSADRGLFARIQGDQLVVEIPEARAAGRVRVDALGQTAWLVEEAPGRFRGPLPCECRRGVRVRVSADPPRWRAVDLPALAAAELRGAGVDVTALDALARAGGGRVLAAGEAPARLPAPSGPPLGPAFLVLAVVVLVLERARAGRRPAARSAT